MLASLSSPLSESESSELESSSLPRSDNCNGQYLLMFILSVSQVSYCIQQRLSITLSDNGNAWYERSTFSSC